MTAPDYISTTAERIRAYHDTLSKHHISYDPSLIRATGTGEEDGARAMSEFLDEHPDFQGCDALFCFTDLQAVGAKKILEQRGISIPDTISIACMSGTRMAALVSPAITTVERPMHTMAQEAVRLLLEKIADNSSEPETVVLSAEMFIRGSTKHK